MGRRPARHDPERTGEMGPQPRRAPAAAIGGCTQGDWHCWSGPRSRIDAAHSAPSLHRSGSWLERSDSRIARAQAYPTRCAIRARRPARHRPGIDGGTARRDDRPSNSPRASGTPSGLILPNVIGFVGAKPRIRASRKLRRHRIIFAIDRQETLFSSLLKDANVILPPTLVGAMVEDEVIRPYLVRPGWRPRSRRGHALAWSRRDRLHLAR